MAGIALSSSSARLLIAPQTARGAVATTGWQRLPWISGNMQDSPRVVTQEQFDGLVYSSPRQEIAGYEAGGEFTVLCDALTAPLIFSGVLGPDTVSGTAPLFTHTQDTDAPGDGRYYTILTETGAGSLIVRRRYANVKITEAEISGNADRQFVDLRFAVVGVSTKENVAALPTTGVAEPEESFLFSDGQGRYQVSDIGAGVTAGISQFSITATRGQEPWQGDSKGIYAVVPGRGQIAVAATLLADDVSLPFLYKTWYGTETPSDGQAASADLFFDSFSLELQRDVGGDIHSLAATVPSLAYAVDSAVDPSLDGGAIELPVAGRAVKTAGAPMLTIATTNGLATAV